jgi:hypothetical protein
MSDAPIALQSAGLPLEHMMTANSLQYARAMRGSRAAAAMAQLATSGRIDALDFGEFTQLQLAAWRRFASLRDSWIEDWQGWWSYSSQTRGVNTASKLAERQANIVAQMAQLLGEQFTDLVGLQENIEVDFAYWVSQKLDR